MDALAENADFGAADEYAGDINHWTHYYASNQDALNVIHQARAAELVADMKASEGLTHTTAAPAATDMCFTSYWGIKKEAKPDNDQIIWCSDGNSVRQWSCGNLAEIQQGIGAKYTIRQIVPVGNNLYAIQCDAAPGKELYNWIIYNLERPGVVCMHSAHKKHQQYAINNCLVINDRYFDLTNWESYELRAGHTLTHYDGKNTITFKKLSHQFTATADRVYYVNGVMQPLGVIVHGAGETTTTRDLYTYRFVTYKGQPADHLPHFGAGYTLGCHYVIGDLILIGSVHKVSMIDNPLCKDYTLKLIWRTKNYQLFQLCRLSSGVRTKIASREAVNYDDDAEAAEAAEAVNYDDDEEAAEAVNYDDDAEAFESAAL